MQIVINMMYTQWQQANKEEKIKQHEEIKNPKKGRTNGIEFSMK